MLVLEKKLLTRSEASAAFYGAALLVGVANGVATMGLCAGATLALLEFPRWLSAVTYALVLPVLWEALWPGAFTRWVHRGQPPFSQQSGNVIIRLLVYFSLGLMVWMIMAAILSLVQPSLSVRQTSWVCYAILGLGTSGMLTGMQWSRSQDFPQTAAVACGLLGGVFGLPLLVSEFWEQFVEPKPELRGQ